MISKPSRHCTVELQALPSRIGQVRRIVSAQLRYWHQDPLIDSAALGVTELLTNVHRHAVPDKKCRVEMDLSRDRLTVSVRDNDPRVPRLRPTDLTAIGGRGLALVASLSESWGVRPRGDGGKIVWFTLQTSTPTVPASATAVPAPVPTLAPYPFHAPAPSVVRGPAEPLPVDALPAAAVRALRREVVQLAVRRAPARERAAAG
ncbi:ATP-binding protein [Streptomyces pathocidini]|uniref:ATP-binding protein n=2 Tax=Streptomyces pathocidini TaxID=1650571 RepID=A0ABW7ULD0_9ACTN